MKIVNKIVFILIKSFFLVVFFSLSYSNAFAYLDPGSTGILLQAIAGIVAGLSTAIYFFKEKAKAFFKKVKSFFKKRNK